MTFETWTEADARRQAGVRRMKLTATGLLVAAAIVFIITRHTTGWLGFVNAAAEAAMVGAFADWFAVTALFRHPLGLPIPHTAIIPTRKDALGHSLEEFVATHFLAKDVVAHRIRAAAVTRRVGVWLRESGNARRVSDEICHVAGNALDAVDDEVVVAALDEVLVQRGLRHTWSPVVGRMLTDIVAQGTHHRLVDIAGTQLADWVENNEHVIFEIVADRSPNWVPAWLDGQVGHIAHHQAVQWAREVRDDPRHPVRGAIDDVLLDLSQSLQHDPAMHERVMQFQRKIADSSQTREVLTELWQTVRSSLVAALRDPTGEIRHRLAVAAADYGQRMATDRQLQATLDRHVENATSYLITRYRTDVVTVISETINHWDGAQAAKKIELHVGRDLQFIRINGTVVGGLVGLLIHTLSVLAG